MNNQKLITKNEVIKCDSCGRVHELEPHTGITCRCGWEIETEDMAICERCGDEVGSILIGDEIYSNCLNCGTGIAQ